MATTQWYSKIQAMAPPSNATMYESKAKTKKKNYRVKDEDIPDHITKPRLSLVEFEEQLTQIRDSEYDDGIDALSGEARKKAEESRLRAKQMFQQHVKRSHEPQEVVLKRRREQAKREILQTRQTLAKPKNLILPDSKFTQRWDVVTSLALIFTAIVTPYEVAVRPDTIESPIEIFWFCINRIVDLIFIVDMRFTFLTAFRKRLKESWTTIDDFEEIRHHYLRGWFVVDFISILPFWIVDIINNGSSNLGFLKIVRIVRLMRLLKLARMVRASRIFKRWEAKLGIPYSIVSLIKFSVMLLVAGHWLACAWCLIASIEPAYHSNWIDALRLSWSFEDDWDSEHCTSLSDDEFIESGCNKPTGWQIYMAALYWALVTITSVGYGDITPKNSFEAGFATFFVLVGSSLWAYIIGNVCGIVATLDAETLSHQQTMDNLNYFMQSRQLPADLKQSIRMFFNVRKEIAKAEKYSSLIDVMSPDLKGEVAYRHNDWLNNVPYLRGCCRKFLVTITEQLRPAVYIPKETINWRNSLSTVSKGVACWHDRVYTAGQFWGEDFILKEFVLKRIKPAYAVTYIEVMSLSHEDLYDQLEFYPTEARQVRRAVCKMAIHRGILWIAKQKLAADQDLTMLIDYKWKHRWESDVAAITAALEDQKSKINPDANLSSNAQLRKHLTKIEKYVLELLIHQRTTAEEHDTKIIEAASREGPSLDSAKSRLASHEPDLDTPTPLSDVCLAVEYGDLIGLKKKLNTLPIYDPSLNEGNKPALHRAVSSKNSGAVTLLLRHGASIKAADIKNRTPIELAAAEGVDHIFFMLVEAHDKSKTAVDWEGLKRVAKENGHMALVTAMDALSHIDEYS